MECGLVVRGAGVGDLRCILAMERASAGAAHWGEEDYSAALTVALPRRVLLVGEVEERVEGFLAARSGHAAEWEVENLVVAEAARRQGLGSALLDAFLEQARERKPSAEALVIHLEVRESNLAALCLYEKFGFVLDKRRRAYYHDPEEDALLYSLSLQ